MREIRPVNRRPDYGVWITMSLLRWMFSVTERTNGLELQDVVSNKQMFLPGMKQKEKCVEYDVTQKQKVPKHSYQSLNVYKRLLP